MGSEILVASYATRVHINHPHTGTLFVYFQPGDELQRNVMMDMQRMWSLVLFAIVVIQLRMLLFGI